MTDKTTIPLFKGRLGSTAETVGWAVVDYEDLGLVDDFVWRIGTHGYAFRHDYRLGEIKRDSVLMHRVVMGLSKGDGMVVDHINRNKLDNRKANLRVCTVAENNQNLRAVKGAVSQHRGVYRRKRDGAWIASVKLDGKAHFLGSYADEDEAGRVAAEWRAEHMPFSTDATRRAA